MISAIVSIFYFLYFLSISSLRSSSMRHLSYGASIIWIIQATLAFHQIEIPELEFLSNNLSPSECLRFHKMLQRQLLPGASADQTQMLQNKPYGFRGSSDCKKLLTSWLMGAKESFEKAHEVVELKLRQIGRTDLAQWLGYNTIHQRQLSEGVKNWQDGGGINTAVRYKGDDDHHLGQGVTAKATTPNGAAARNGSTQTLIQKLVITIVAILSMTTLCLCCYKFLYGRMRGGHFTAFRREFDEESWLNNDQERERGAGSSCGTNFSHNQTRQSLWDSVDRNLVFKPFSILEYFKSKFKRHADCSRDKRCRQFRHLISRLQNTCPTQRKIIRLNRNEQSLLKSLTDAEKYQLPATDSDFKFLVASDREKRKLLAREGRREFLVELRKRLETIRPGDGRNVTLNETEREIIRKLSSSERLLLPIMNNDLELLVSSPLEKRQLMLKQIASKFDEILPEDRKYLELDYLEKRFLKEIDDHEKKKLGLTDSELRFLVASRSQRNLMQRRLDTRRREQRVKEIHERLSEVKRDISRLELSKTERSTFLSLNSFELAQLGLTEEHVKYYSATDSEKRVMWPSPSQHRSLRIDTLQTKLSKLPWKEGSARLTSSEHTLLASLTRREQGKLHISDSEKNFMLSTDSEKELIQRQRKIERLEAKIRDFNTVTMTESERGLILSLSPSEMEMLNIDSTNKCSLLERKSNKRSKHFRESRIGLLREKIESNRHARLTESEQALLSSLTSSEMVEISLSGSQVDLLLSNTSRNDREHRRTLRMEMIKERIRHEGLGNVRLTNSERGLIQSLTDCELNSANLTPSELSFLLADETERGNSHSCAHESPPTGCSQSRTGDCSSSPRDPRMNTTEHHCHRHVDSSASNCRHNVDNRSHGEEYRHKVQFEDLVHRSAESNALVEESTDDSELSETYDELGMLFSQQMKEQARPCQRKYCLLGRHLKRGNHHDERQCQMRQQCCRGYPSDQRPSCSSGNVCTDTYDEFNLMHAKADQKKQLNSSIFERRKQFLDQPCQHCPGGHDNSMSIN